MKIKFATIICLLFVNLTYSHYEKLTLEQLYGYSDAVIIAEVISQRPIRYPAGLKTEITFRIGKIVSQRPGINIQGETITESFAGGTMNDVSFSVCGQPHFENAKTYLLFMYVGKNYMSCVVGGNQGMFEIIEEDNNQYLTNGNGEKVSFYDDVFVHKKGQFLTPKAPIPVSNDNLTASRTTFQNLPILSLEQNLQTLQSISESILYLNNIPLDYNEVTCITDLDTFKLPLSNLIRYDDQNQPDILNMPKAGTLGYCGVQSNKPYVFEVNDVLGIAQTEFNYAMGDWNVYMPILLTTNGDNTFQGGNYINEFAGWQDNATMNTQYGFTWGPGAIAVCHTYAPVGCYDIVEADIAFNPAFSVYYGISDQPVPAGVIKFTTIAMHEIGHSWGYQREMYTETYDYNQPSVMHSFYNSLYENDINIHTPDAYLVREAYDAWISEPSIIDVGVESYYASNGLNASYVTDNVLNAGDMFYANGITVENLSNSTVNQVDVNFFLVNTSAFVSFPVGSYMFTSFGGEQYSVFDYQLFVPNNICSGTYVLQVSVNPVGYTEIPTGFFNNLTTVIGNIYVNEASSPIVFNSSTQNGTAPLWVNYTVNNPYSNIASVVWNFEGGTPSTSTNFNENVLYTTSGIYDVTLDITDYCGNADHHQFYNYINVTSNGIEDENQSNAMYFYNSTLFIQGSFGDGELEVYNILGQLLERKKVNSNAISFDSYSTGIYLGVATFDGKQKSVLRFIKQ